MNMAKKGIVTGLVLIALGMIGYFVGGRVSVTALIPAFVGLPILLSSLLARAPEKRKLGMHLAVFFGLLGFLASLGKLVSKVIKGEFELGLSTGSMMGMSLVCLIFVIQCVKSFKAARAK